MIERMDIKFPVEFPAIDLGSALPIIALVVLGALILFTLTARSLIQSRAFTIAIVAAVVVLGSSTIVGSLQAIALLIGVAGIVTIGLVLVLHRSPDVTDLLHIVVSRRESTPQLPPATRPLQLNAGQSVKVVTQRTSHTTRPPQGWGFDD